MRTELSPGLVIATPHLQDPNFDHTVVLLFQHGAEGAMGLIINRDVDIAIDQVMADLGVESEEDLGQRVQTGGPVSRDIGWIVHTPDYTEATTRRITDGVAISTSREALEAISAGAGPSRFMLCLGYAGWGPEQLEEEIADGAWLTMPVVTDILFDVPLDERWRVCYERLGISPHQLAPIIGNA